MARGPSPESVIQAGSLYQVLSISQRLADLNLAET
jgi:hypothetical protein